MQVKRLRGQLSILRKKIHLNSIHYFRRTFFRTIFSFKMLHISISLRQNNKYTDFENKHAPINKSEFLMRTMAFVPVTICADL